MSFEWSTEVKKKQKGEKLKLQFKIHKVSKLKVDASSHSCPED